MQIGETQEISPVITTTPAVVYLRTRPQSFLPFFNSPPRYRHLRLELNPQQYSLQLKTSSNRNKPSTNKMSFLMSQVTHFRRVNLTDSVTVKDPETGEYKTLLGHLGLNIRGLDRTTRKQEDILLIFPNLEDLESLFLEAQRLAVEAFRGEEEEAICHYSISTDDFHAIPFDTNHHFASMSYYYYCLYQSWRTSTTAATPVDHTNKQKKAEAFKEHLQLMLGDGEGNGGGKERGREEYLRCSWYSPYHISEKIAYQDRREVGDNSGTVSSVPNCSFQKRDNSFSPSTGKQVGGIACSAPLKEEKRTTYRRDLDGREGEEENSYSCSSLDSIPRPDGARLQELEFENSELKKQLTRAQSTLKNRDSDLAEAHEMVMDLEKSLTSGKVFLEEQDKEMKKLEQNLAAQSKELHGQIAELTKQNKDQLEQNVTMREKRPASSAARCGTHSYEDSQDFSQEDAGGSQRKTAPQPSETPVKKEIQTVDESHLSHPPLSIDAIDTDRSQDIVVDYDDDEETATTTDLDALMARILNPAMVAPSLSSSGIKEPLTAKPGKKSFDLFLDQDL